MINTALISSPTTRCMLHLSARDTNCNPSATLRKLQGLASVLWCRGFVTVTRYHIPEDSNRQDRLISQMTVQVFYIFHREIYFWRIHNFPGDIVYRV